MATQPAAQSTGGGASDQGLITGSIEAVFVSADPVQACETFVTEAYVTEAFGDASGCRAAQVPAAAATSVDVSRVEVSGDGATAIAVPHGGPSDAQSVHVALRRDEGVWKVDSLRSDVPVGP
ncbi:MAG: hypothetical protein ACXWD7_05195, partial [Solirubrobacterales bacterium]